ncbi:hypothetical protein NC652_024310 [Populus alba x Populus x berolinensis]|nr:hypothetical protein NC652_024310 [Populus alba x Populus x berolinensis]
MCYLAQKGKALAELPFSGDYGFTGMIPKNMVFKNFWGPTTNECRVNPHFMIHSFPFELWSEGDQVGSQEHLLLKAKGLSSLIVFEILI